MMKRHLFLLLIFLPLLSPAQNPTTLDGWAQRLKLFGEKVPQEEVFVHMDNSCYYLGDTLYFKAYMRLSDGRPSPLSRLLYVELLNHDGYLVERQKVEMKQGQGYGSFCLPDTLYGGYYELRAYTRWQLNWGGYEHAHTKSAEKWFLSNKMMHEYYRDYDKLYSRVFPVYDHPRQPGDYAQDMTLRPLRRQFRQKDEKPKATVTFYPEGGNLVAGVPNRVAFEANDEEGRHLKGELRIESSSRIKAVTASRGRGTFVITPEAGERLKATFEWEGGSQDFDLPRAEADGVALRAEAVPEGIRISLHRAGLAAREALGLTASCHGILKDFQTVDGDDLLVPQDKLPTGVIQLTVFNADGRIWADRLVFFRRPDFQPQNIAFTGLKEQYEPYEEVTLGVSCPSSGEAGRGAISLAVRDAVHSDYTFDSGNILTEMLLASQIKGFVEQPEYFFEADDAEHRQALDLLLMVQGWRRYDWVEMATPGMFTLTQPYEQTEVLLGEVSKYMSEAQSNSVMEAMDQHQAQYESDQEYLAKRSATLQGEDHSEITQAEAGSQTISEMETGRDERFAADDTHQGTTQKTNAEVADRRFKRRYRGQDHGSLRTEALLHAEFVQPGAKQGESMVEGEMDTYDNGLFKIEAPRFYEYCYFSYAAVPKSKWKGEAHIWVDTNEDKNGRINYPDYYVKLSPVYPRFVKPYGFYQKNIPAARQLGGRLLHVDDDAILMDEVTVGARRSGLRRFDASKPAFVLDAYEAFNEVCDAGFCPGYFIGSERFAFDIARTFVGDMNQERAYDLEQRFNSKNKSAFLSGGTLEKYNHLPNLDMVYVYTDYSPRREGDKRFSQADQPTVTVDLRGFEDGSQRMTWRDRRMLLRGFSVCEDFYQPDYSRQTPPEPTDYRRTLYWNPNVGLDAEGRAVLHFYNNSRTTQLSVSAEGMAADGQLLTGSTYPGGR